jgi:NAD(P)-dependent dehydrogenase (short-subunit alcohol dehydrogenase family)
MALPQTPSFRLDGKRALVTGASSGIGFGCAAACAQAGAEVFAMARSADKLEMLAAEAREAGLNIIAVPLDVTDIDALKRWLDGQPAFDVVVNSAGIARHGPALDTRTEDFDAVVDVNLKSAYFLASYTAQKMIAEQIAGSIERSVYCATKSAVEGFTKAMAIEWGPHKVRINTICPTFIRTALTESTFNQPERIKWIEEKIKLGRVGEVEDIMGAVVFMASDAASLITGTSLLVDGGWTAG